MKEPGATSISAAWYQRTSEASRKATEAPTTAIAWLDGQAKTVLGRTTSSEGAPDGNVTLQEEHLGKPSLEDSPQLEEACQREPWKATCSTLSNGLVRVILLTHWEDSIAEVIFADKRVGTAFLVLQDTLVTAQHVIAGLEYESSNIWVRFHGTTTKWRCKVHIPFDVPNDLALMEIVDEKWEANSLPIPINFYYSRYVPDNRHNWQTLAFPRGQSQGSLALSGYVASSQARDNGIRRIQLNYDQGNAELLKYSSGSPVIFEGKAIGIIIKYNKNWPDTVLYAADIAQSLDKIPKLSIVQHKQTKTEENPSAALITYLRRLRTRADTLPYRNVLESILHQRNWQPPNLTRVYVQAQYRSEYKSRFDTANQSKPNLRKIQIEHVIGDHENLVLQGDPGSGKSSFINKFAANSAAEILDAGASIDVPVLINARDFVLLNGGSIEKRLHQYITRTFRVDLTEDIFQSAPFSGRKWFLLVDGVDEVVDYEKRLSFIEEIIDYSKEMGGSFRFLVASRPLADTSRFPTKHFGHYIVLPFSDVETRDFAIKWFREVCENGGAGEASEFLKALENTSLKEISTVPAMLTIAAIVFLSDRASELPRNRIQLYQKYLDAVSKATIHSDREKNLRKYLNDLEYGEVGIRFVGRLVSRQFSVFGDLAHRRQSNTDQRSDLDDAIEVILSRANELSVPEDLRQATKIKPIVEEYMRGSGLFTCTDETYEFVHNTVREFILAKKLASECEPTANGQWELIRRWSDARWREIVLFSIAIWTRDPDLRDRMGRFLRQIASSGARGVHFAGVAVAEGAHLSESDTDWIVDQLIERARKWSACAEVLSNFASPDPVEVLRLMPDHPRLRAALMQYVIDGGNGCPESLYSLFDFASNIASPQELIEISQSDSALWVRAGAALALWDRGEQEVAVPFLVNLAKSSGGQVGVDVLKALAEKGCYKEIATIFYDEDVKPVVRLAAGLFHPSDPKEDRIPNTLLNDVVDEITSWNKVSDDVILKLAKANRIDGLLSSGELSAVDRVSICKKLVENGISKAAIVHLRDVTIDNSNSAHIRLDAAIILLDCQEIDFLKQHLAELSMLGESGAKEKVQVSKILARFGDLDKLIAVLNDCDFPAVYRADAAASLAFHGQKAFALDKVAQLAKEQALKDEDRRAYSALLARLGDPNAAINCLLDAPQDSGVRFRGPLRTLVELGRSNDLMVLSKSAKLTDDDRVFAVQGIGQLGRCDLLFELACQADLSAVVRFEAIKELRRLAWTEEAKNAAVSLLESCSDPALLIKVLREATKLGVGIEKHRYLKFVASSPDADAGSFHEAVRSLIDNADEKTVLLAALGQITNQNSRPETALSAARSFVSEPDFEKSLSYVHRQAGSPHLDVAIDYICGIVVDCDRPEDDRRNAFFAIPEISAQVEGRGVVDAVLQFAWEDALQTSWIADHFAKLRRLDLTEKVYQSCLSTPRDLSYKTWLVGSMIQNGFGDWARDILLADKESYSEANTFVQWKKWNFLSQLGKEAEAAEFYRERLLEVSRDGKGLSVDLEKVEPSEFSDWLVALASVDQTMVPLKMAFGFANCEKIDFEIRLRVIPSLIDLGAGTKIAESLRRARSDRRMDVSLRFTSAVLLHVLDGEENLKDSMSWFFQRDEELNSDSLIQLLWVVRDEDEYSYFLNAVLEYATTRYDHTSRSVFTDYLYDHGFKEPAFFLLSQLAEVNVIVFAGKLIDRKEYSDAKEFLEMNSERMLDSSHRIQFQNKLNEVMLQMEGR